MGYPGGSQLPSTQTPPPNAANGSGVVHPPGVVGAGGSEGGGGEGGGGSGGGGGGGVGAGSGTDPDALTIVSTPAPGRLVERFCPATIVTSGRFACIPVAYDRLYVPAGNPPTEKDPPPADATTTTQRPSGLMKATGSNPPLAVVAPMRCAPGRMYFVYCRVSFVFSQTVTTLLMSATTRLQAQLGPIGGPCCHAEFRPSVRS